MTTSKGGKPATGAVKWRFNPKRLDPETGKPAPDFQWWGRVILTNGKRPWVPLDPSILEHETERARACAVETAAWFRKSPTAESAVKETVGEWFERFHDAKEAKGLASVAEMRGYAKNWILPGIEHKAPTAVTRQDVEGIVRRLDAAILAWHKADGKRGNGKLSSSSAANIWGHLSHSFDEMVSAKDPSLRVLAASPCTGVRGPEAGPDRAGPILYSNEVLALLRGKAVDPGMPDVPLWRRRTWAGALYTKTRRSELAAITADDVDQAHLTFSVTKQVKRTDKGRAIKGTKKTKTQRSRTPDLEPHLLPLILHLVKHPEGEGGRLFRVPRAEDYPELLRRDLWTVGVRDTRLHTEDSTRTKMTGHCLRDTGLTMMAVRGDSPIAIQWTAGHTDFKMTQGYLDRGKVEARRIGEPLPPLPPEMLEGIEETAPTPPTGFGSGFGTVRTGVPNFSGNSVGATGFEEKDVASEPLRSAIENLAAEVRSESRVGKGPAIQTARVSPGLEGVSAGSAMPNADEAELEARMIECDLAGNETRARAYQRRLEALRAAKMVRVPENVVAAAHRFGKKSTETR